MALILHHPLSSVSGFTALDTSGNGRDLNANLTGTNLMRGGSYYPDRYGAPGMFAVATLGPSRLDASLRLTGNMTWVALCWTRSANPNQTIVCCGGSTNALADNVLYGLQTYTAPTNLYRRLRYFHEHSTGPSVQVNFDSTVEIQFGATGSDQASDMPPVVLAFRRTDLGGGNVQVTVSKILRDGTAVHQTSGTLAAPGGGSGSRYAILNRTDGTSETWKGHLEEVHLYDHVLTDLELETLAASLFVTTGASDEIAPVIDNISPASASTVTRFEPINFDVTDETELAHTQINVTYSDGSTEAIYDGSTFSADFNADSSATPISGGYSFSVSREGSGWVRNFTLGILAVDGGGNTASASPTYTVSNPTGSPTISNVSPAAGSTLSRNDAISFRITDETEVVDIILSARYPSGAHEVIYRAGAFTATYSESTRSAVAEASGSGFDFVIRRAGGWPAKPEICLDVVDSDGNLAE